MNISEAKEKITDLIEAAEEDHRWGGSETSDGVLMPGPVDWDKLKEDIAAVLVGLENDKDLARRALDSE